MALHLLEATLTQGPSCSADDIAELEIHVRNEIERYVQLEIERELYELAQTTINDALLTSAVCSGGEVNNEASKKRIKADSDAAKTSAKTSMESDQQLTELKNKYLTKIAGPLSTLEALKLIVDKQSNEKTELENEIVKLKQLYNAYHQNDEYSSKLFENMKILNQTQLAVSKHQSLSDLHSSNGDHIDSDQFEQLSTLLFHKMLHLPLIEMKTKQLQKPKKN